MFKQNGLSLFDRKQGTIHYMVFHCGIFSELRKDFFPLGSQFCSRTLCDSQSTCRTQEIDRTVVRTRRNMEIECAFFRSGTTQPSHFKVVRTRMEDVLQNWSSLVTYRSLLTVDAVEDTDSLAKVIAPILGLAPVYYYDSGGSPENYYLSCHCLYGLLASDHNQFFLCP